MNLVCGAHVILLHYNVMVSYYYVRCFDYLSSDPIGWVKWGVGGEDGVGKKEGYHIPQSTCWRLELIAILISVKYQKLCSIGFVL